MGKGDRASGGRGTKKGLLYEAVNFVQQSPFMMRKTNHRSRK